MFPIKMTSRKRQAFYNKAIVIICLTTCHTPTSIGNLVFIGVSQRAIFFC